MWQASTSGWGEVRPENDTLTEPISLSPWTRMVARPLPELVMSGVGESWATKRVELEGVLVASHIFTVVLIVVLPKVQVRVSGTSIWKSGLG